MFLPGRIDRISQRMPSQLPSAPRVDHSFTGGACAMKRDHERASWQPSSIGEQLAKTAALRITVCWFSFGVKS
jgi:hypothetical protein